jgi:hypothetical protein
MLGTYNTVDCPTEQKEEALNFLREEFSKIGGVVRVYRNPHDFGEYPSFEIDYPRGLENVDELESEQEEIDKQDKWNKEAEKIIEEYNLRFEKYL